MRELQPIPLRRLVEASLGPYDRLNPDAMIEIAGKVFSLEERGRVAISPQEISIGYRLIPLGEEGPERKIAALLGKPGRVFLGLHGPHQERVQIRFYEVPRGAGCVCPCGEGLYRRTG